MLSILMMSLAAAATVEAWAYSDFPTNGGVAGEDGWVNGYDEDEWAAFESRGVTWAYSTTDHTDGGRFGEGGALDNWLVNPAVEVLQGEYTVTSYVTDNDAFGIVMGVQEGEYLLLLVCGEEDNESSMQTCPVPGLSTQATALVRIRGRNAEVLDSVEVGCTGGREVEMSVSIDDGLLVARYGDAEVSAEVDVRQPLTGVGFYAYNEGTIDEEGQDDGNTVYFRDVVVSWMDEDDDGVVDDEDNCEEEANPGQEDLDHDGIGSACDLSEDTPDTGDTGEGDTGEADDDTAGGISIDQNGCGCASGGAAAGVGALVAGLAALARRRGGGRTIG